MPAAFVVIAVALIAVGLHHPIRDGLRRRLELLGQIVGTAPITHQRNDLLAKLRRIRGTASWQLDVLACSKGQMSNEAGQLHSVLITHDLDFPI